MTSCNLNYHAISCERRATSTVRYTSWYTQFQRLARHFLVFPKKLKFDHFQNWAWPNQGNFSNFFLLILVQNLSADNFWLHNKLYKTLPREDTIDFLMTTFPFFRKSWNLTIFGTKRDQTKATFLTFSSKFLSKIYRPTTLDFITKSIERFLGKIRSIF